MRLAQTPRLGTRRRRVGCLGALVQIVIVLALAGIGLTLFTGVFYPWAFYLGGGFHIFPGWQGWGKLHAKGGDYLLYVFIQPTPTGSKMYLATNLTGMSYVCTPRGEKMRLTLGGGMRKHLNLSTDGEAIRLYMHRWSWNRAFSTQYAPRLELSGHWQNPDLVMDDKGSIGRAFQPDGTVYLGNDPKRPYATDIVPITLVRGSYWDFASACDAMRR
jgi:hypothetical protein